MHNPKRAVRTTLRNYGVMDGLFSVPLYMIASIGDILFRERTEL